MYIDIYQDFPETDNDILLVCCLDDGILLILEINSK